MKRVGLFVGINDYDEIPKLSCAVNDATQLSIKFSKAQYDEVELLHDRQCNSINIVNKVTSLVSDLTPGDIFVFYFAGHGRENNGVLYLAGVSSRSDLFGHDSVSIPDLIKVTNKRGLNRLFILDCCRNDILGGSRAASVEVCSDARDIALTNAVVQNQDQEIIPPLILNSCSAGQLAFENRAENHGYFTSALLKVINDTAVNSFDLFRSNLKITGTPKPQNISWAGSFDNWRDILLFKHWGNKSGPKPDPIPTPPRKNPDPEPVPEEKIFSNDSFYDLKAELEKKLSMEVPDIPEFKEKHYDISSRYDAYRNAAPNPENFAILNNFLSETPSLENKILSWQKIQTLIKEIGELEKHKACQEVIAEGIYLDLKQKYEMARSYNDYIYVIKYLDAMKRKLYSAVLRENEREQKKREEKEQEKKEKIFLGGFALAVLIFLGIVAFDPFLGLIISAVGFCGAVIAVKKYR